MLTYRLFPHADPDRCVCPAVRSIRRRCDVQPDRGSGVTRQLHGVLLAVEFVGDAVAHHAIFKNILRGAVLNRLHLWGRGAFNVVAQNGSTKNAQCRGCGPVTLTTHPISGGYELKDPSRGNQYTINMGNKSTGGAIYKDVDNTWGDGTLIDLATVAVDAQYGTAVTWDYYLLVHGRNGISNNGVGAYNRVHYNRKYNNAFWSDSCFCMTYGDGDGLTFNPFDSLDVAGHEMSHGVTSRTANLTYSGESGGLNEATSDIFGTMVEFYANNSADTPDYKIGEKLYKSGSGKALRYMYSPNTDGASADCWYAGVGSLDVHYSSGVANHFYYLLAEGTAAAAPLNTSSPTCVAGNTRKATGNASLTGIGRDKAEKIWFRALTVHMTSATNYAGARTATPNAAADLYGANSTEQQAVAAAWAAVLVN